MIVNRMLLDQRLMAIGMSPARYSPAPWWQTPLYRNNDSTVIGITAPTIPSEVGLALVPGWLDVSQANADIIMHAPLMHAYLAKRASEGDHDAWVLLRMCAYPVRDIEPTYIALTL